MKSSNPAALSFALILLARGALAEPPRENSAPAPSAGSDPTEPSEPTTEPSQDSREYLVALVKEGARLYDAEAYDAAIEKLREAYSLNASPTIGVVLAHAYRDSARLGEAIDGYEVVATAQLSADSHPKVVEAVEMAKSELARLRRSVAWLTLTVEGPAEFDVSFNGAPIEPHRSGAYVLGRGAYTIVVSAEGFETETLELAAEPGSRPTEVVKLETVASAQAPPAPKSRPAPVAKKPRPRAPATQPVVERSEAYGTWGTASLITGLVGAAGGGALALYAKLETDASSQFCTDNVCSSEAGPHLDRAGVAANVATIAFVASGALIATGIGLLIYDQVDETNYQRDKLAVTEVRIAASATGAAIIGKF